jgi:hypothetical protein
MKTQSKQSADGVRYAGVKLNKQLIAKRREIDWTIMQRIRAGGWGTPRFWEILDNRIAGGKPITERRLIPAAKIVYCQVIAGSPYSDLLTDEEWELAATDK